MGFAADSSGVEVTLAEGWNGTSWSVQATPNPPPAQRSLFLGVSCTSAIACTAVGGYNDSTGAEVTLAEAWNGSSWSIQKLPTLPGARGSGLNGVSCTSAGACTAVGIAVDSSGVDVTLAEAWNGSSWSIQATPNPAGAGASILIGVSCTSASRCTAAGEYAISSGLDLTLVEVRP